MERLQINFSTSGKALPPRPIRVEVPGWGGSPDRKKVDGSEPEPWHCPPFVEASTHGLELLFQYEECHVINDNGVIRFDWKGGGPEKDGEFGIFAPLPTQFYFFGTSVDLQAPPGHVLRTQAHPRFFTDQTGTVPCALSGHVQTEWFPKKVFVVFKVPRPGERNIFRKGEPYVQVLFIPHRVTYEPVRMNEEHDAQRRQLEHDILFLRAHLAQNVWYNPEGQQFDDHYKQLGGAFARDGTAGVARALERGFERLWTLLPEGKTMHECLDLAHQRQMEGKVFEAKNIYYAVLSKEPLNVEAISRLAILTEMMGQPKFAVTLMQRAVSLRPESPLYHGNLGVMLRNQRLLREAEAEFRMCLQLKPNDSQSLSNLGLTLAQQGRMPEALQACQAATSIGPRLPNVHFRLGRVLAMNRQYAQARACYQNALALAPGYEEARQALRELTAIGPV